MMRIIVTINANSRNKSYLQGATQDSMTVHPYPDVYGWHNAGDEIPRNNSISVEGTVVNEDGGQFNDYLEWRTDKTLNVNTGLYS